MRCPNKIIFKVKGRLICASCKYFFFARSRHKIHAYGYPYSPRPLSMSLNFTICVSALWNRCLNIRHCWSPVILARMPQISPHAPYVPLQSSCSTQSLALFPASCPAGSYHLLPAWCSLLPAQSVRLLLPDLSATVLSSLQHLLCAPNRLMPWPSLFYAMQ